MIAKIIDLIRTARNPKSTWNVATSGERAAVFFLLIVLLYDVIRFAFIDVALDTAMIVLLYLYIWDEVEFTKDDL